MPEGEGAPLGRGRRFGTTEFGADVEEELHHLLKGLLSCPHRLRSLVVFGSRARGDWKPWSDTDVVIIVEAKSIAKWAPLHGLGLPRDAVEVAERSCVEARVFTPERFRELLRSFNLTALDALEEGVVLFDDGFWREVKAEFERMKASGWVEKIPIGWRIRRGSAPLHGKPPPDAHKAH